MDVFEAIYGRRSIRAYNDEDVPLEILMKAIECGIHAPSAGNLQPWEFIIVRDREIKEKLYRACFSQSQVRDAPVLIVVCADIMRSAYYGQRGMNLYAIQDTAAATQNILLALYALGYATCWIGAFNEGLVKNILNLPKDVRPLAIITVGKGAEKPQKRELRELKDVVHFEKFT
ncbi:MAG: nitroreductase family protein [Thermoplasmata archaeon]|nr:nitroreductase family protein [Thermoplasmata archaeon]